MDVFQLRDAVIGDYEEFVKGFLNVRDGRIRAVIEETLADGLLWPEPWLSLNPKFTAGGTIDDLVLEQAGIMLEGDLGEAGSKAGSDDVLDAAVAAWSAVRIAAGDAISLPSPPEVGATGRPIAIWA